MENLIGKTIRLTVRLDNLDSGTVTYEDFQNMPKIGSVLKNVQFIDCGNRLSEHGKLLQILNVEQYYFGEWREVATMTKDQLHTIGRALYGSQWQTELARNIVNLDGEQLDKRRVQQWACGARPVPNWILPKLKDLAKTRKHEVEQILNYLQIGLN